MSWTFLDVEKEAFQLEWILNVTSLSVAGLPDGTFSYQKSRFGYVLKGLRMKSLDIFYRHSVQLTAVWCIL
jgi:hypothetical protein